MSDVALIGDPADPEFARLIPWLRSVCPSSLDRVCRRISDWERVYAGAVPRLTIVLQAWSDQYAPAEVDRVIGATLYSGLFCCFGAWCEGDGRTRSLWPASTRVPVRYAVPVLDTELQRMNAGRATLPPTATRDEVFLRRQSDDSGTEPADHGSALVISQDRVYRSTLAESLRSLGWDADASVPGPHSSVAQRSPQLLVHALDPWCDTIERSVQWCQARFPESKLCGVASLPGDAPWKDDVEIPVVPLLDPHMAAVELTTCFAVNHG